MRRWELRAIEWAERRELPTWILTCTIYGGWLALTAGWHAVPIWIAAPLAAWLCAWHMSLQHELIHGHPTRNEQLNFCLAVPPLSLWLPYPLYREAHLRHHRAEYLTDPLEDPESTYMSPLAWMQAGPWRRRLHLVCNTAVGRVLLGPGRAMVQFWWGQVRLAGEGQAPWRAWFGHAAGVGLVLAWICCVCRINLLVYLACFVYPGTALIMIRSLAEHRAADRPRDRTAVVETSGLLGLLFLNNNLHALHHERPSIPWFSLPAQWRATRAVLLESWHGPLYRGYRDVARQYALTPHHPGPHPILPDACSVM